MRGMERGVGVALCVVLHVHTVLTVSSQHRQQLSVNSSLGNPVAKGDNPWVRVFLEGKSQSRVKRAVYRNKDVRGFSDAEKSILVEKHNQLRRKEGSSDMMYMYWDKHLEKFAQSWVEGCAFVHTSSESRENIGTHSVVGENLFVSSGSYDPNHVVQMWYDEKPYYDYNTGSCSDVCGHYTQVVWASSYAIGCGVKYCPSVKKFGGGRSGFLVSCTYGPAGNYRGVTPFQKGKACSACSPQSTYCEYGLCAKYRVVGPPPDGRHGANIGTGGASSRDLPLLVLIGCFAVSAMLSGIVT